MKPALKPAPGRTPLPRRSVHTLALALPLLALLGSTPARALDPFDTEALAPPRPLLGGPESARPCPEGAATAPLDLVEVV